MMSKDSGVRCLEMILPFPVVRASRKRSSDLGHHPRSLAGLSSTELCAAVVSRRTSRMNANSNATIAATMTMLIVSENNAPALSAARGSHPRRGAVNAPAAATAAPLAGSAALRRAKNGCAPSLRLARSGDQAGTIDV